MTFETFIAAVRAFAVPVNWKRSNRKRTTKETIRSEALVSD